MKANKGKIANPSAVAQKARLEHPREGDRRKESCEGFTYVSTVGWICRRERIRRQDSERTSR